MMSLSGKYPKCRQNEDLPPKQGFYSLAGHPKKEKKEKKRENDFWKLGGGLGSRRVWGSPSAGAVPDLCPHAPGVVML